ncbi:hypothetical protein [Pedobacter sp. KLB.chiD]|uniref:hypothetical protein n=1 Tax=Pedobacter sp. KLB.chiD TaxID=3387402 RepID=UPI00399BB485
MCRKDADHAVATRQLKTLALLVKQVQHDAADKPIDIDFPTERSGPRFIRQLSDRNNEL